MSNHDLRKSFDSIGVYSRGAKTNMFRITNLIVLLVVVVSVGIALAQSSPSSSGWSPGQVLETSLLFHPIKAKEGWIAPPSNLPVEDVWLKAADGNRIHAWWLARDGSRGAILFCHGNGGNLSYWRPAMVALVNHLGQSVLIFDYPGYGRSEGKPSEAGCYAAADAAYLWLVQTQRIPGERITLFGESLGGGVATDLAARKPHRALVLTKTVTSIPDMAKKSLLSSASASLVHNQFDNLAKIGRSTGPIFIAHGDRDRLIPLAQGQKLYQAAPEPKQFFLMKGCDHNDPRSVLFANSRSWEAFDSSRARKIFPSALESTTGEAKRSYSEAPNSKTRRCSWLSEPAERLLSTIQVSSFSYSSVLIRKS